MKDLIIFLSENWKVLSWGGTCLVVIITIVFNLFDRYRKIPAMCKQIDILETEKVDQKDCTKDHIEGPSNLRKLDERNIRDHKLIQDDLKRLDHKICKEVGKVQTTLAEMERARGESKDKLSDHLLDIHQTLGLIQGELKRVSN